MKSSSLCFRSCYSALFRSDIHLSALGVLRILMCVPITTRSSKKLVFLMKEGLGCEI